MAGESAPGPASSRARRARSAWRRWLSTTRGLATLFGVTLGAAVIAAFVLVASRGFFEGLIVEKYPALSPDAQVVIARLEARSDPPEQILRDVPFGVLREVYGLWMTAPSKEQEALLPEALMIGRPRATRTLIERSLVAGDAGQKRRALVFALATGSSAVAESLRLGLRRAREVGDDDLAARLEDALGRLSTLP